MKHLAGRATSFLEKCGPQLKEGKGVSRKSVSRGRRIQRGNKVVNELEIATLFCKNDELLE